MQKCCYILIPLLLILSGCGAFSSKTAFWPVDGLSEAKISPRTVPAKISKESDQDLKSKGGGFALSQLV